MMSESTFVNAGSTSGRMADSSAATTPPPLIGRSRTMLWCVPRSVSTALSKCLSFIEGNEVWFEPYTYCRVAMVTAQERLNIHVPPEYEGNEQVYQRAADLFDEICQCKARPEYLSFAAVGKMLESSASPHVFVKDMAYVMTQDDFKFIPTGYKHTFLIRHPLRVFYSFRKAMYKQLSTYGLLTGEAANEETFDIGRHYSYMDPNKIAFKDIYDVWKFVRENFDNHPIVIDGDELLAKPAEVLSRFCREVGLPFNESLMKWDASTEILKKWIFPAEGLVEKSVYIYETAVKSSEFLPASKMPSRDQVTPDVIRCADEVMKYYDEMYEARMKI